MVKKISLKTATHVTPKKIREIDSLILQDKAIVLIHADWCGACQTFKPE